MSDEIEKELMAMLSEPTHKKVSRDIARAEILMRAAGRALAPTVNKVLADLNEKIKEQNKTKP